MRVTSLILISLVAASPAFGVSVPSEWDFGPRRDDALVTGRLWIKNDENRRLAIRLLPSCGCLMISPDYVILDPGDGTVVSVAFDPSGYSGKVEKAILVRVAGGVDRIIGVRGEVTARVAPVPDYPGECEWCRKQSEELRRQAYESWRNQPGVIHYYYSPDCASCSEFLNTEVPRMARKLGKSIEVDSLDVRAPGVLSELDATLSKRSVPLKAFPVLFIGDTVLQGEKDIRKNAWSALEKLEGKKGT
jgi:hypothetical protein